MLTHGILAPHPPAIIPKVGKEETKKFEKTIQALLAIGLKLKKLQPQTLIVITPHADVEVDRFVVRIPKDLNFRASFEEFGDSETTAEFTRDRLFTAQLVEGIQSAGMQTSVLENEKLDFGSAIPLFYFASFLPAVEVVNVGISFSGAPEHQKLGEVIREVAEKSEKRVVLIVSGELSHKVTKNSPHGFDPASAEWDERIIEALKKGDYEKVLHQDPFELDEIEECGFRGICTLLGAFQNIPHTQEILSYEAPGGIGCAVGLWERTNN